MYILMRSTLCILSPLFHKFQKLRMFFWDVLSIYRFASIVVRLVTGNRAKCEENQINRGRRYG